MSLRIKIWLHVPSTPSFIDQWNYLFQAAERKEIFNSYEWVKACAECIGPRRIALIAGFDKDRLVGLAPISMYRGVIEWLTGHWSDYCDFLSYSSYHSNFFSACCNYLRNRYTDWQRIKLSNVPENTSILKTLKDSRTCFEYGYTWTYKNTEPILDFDNASQEELKTILQKKGVERKIKTLSRNGILEYRMAEDAADIKELLKMFSAWHVQRFASLGLHSCFNPKERNTLYDVMTNLCSGPLTSIKLCIPVLWFNHKPIAMYIAFRLGKDLRLYSTAFDEGWSKNSPGEILTYLMVRSCNEQRLSKIDFGIGSQSYKLRFANSFRKGYELIIYRHRWQMNLAAAFERLRLFAKQPIQGNHYGRYNENGG